MRRLLVLALAAVVVIAAAGLWLAQRDEPDRLRRPDHVILIDWDGFDPDDLRRARMPNLDALIARGTLSIAQNTYPTVSNSLRASMVTGAYPERHGNLAYFFDSASGLVKGQDRTIGIETITEALARRGRSSACVQWYMVEGRGVAADDPQHLYVAPGGPFADRVTAAIDILNRIPVPNVPHFLAVYGDDVDALVHREGSGSPNLLPLLIELDTQLGRLVQVTKDIGIFDRTAFIVTSDHGMTDWSQPVPALGPLADLTAAGYRPEIVPVGSAPAPDTDVIIVPSVRTAAVRLRGAAATQQGRDAVRSAVGGLVPTYVSRVLETSDLLGLRVGDRLADFVLEAQPPYAFVAAPLAGGLTEGAHSSTAEQYVPLVLSGPGFRPGVAPREPKLVDVAPTIAALLGIRPPAQAQGRSLTSVR